MIVAEDVTQQANDKQQLHPVVEPDEANRQAVGVKEKIGVTLADAGYSSDGSFTKTHAGDVDLLIATQKDWKQRKAMRNQPSPRARIPLNLSATELMERKLRTNRGRTLYKLRSQTSSRCSDRLKMFEVSTGSCGGALALAAASGH